MKPATRDQDLSFMRRALALAKRGEGFVSPNPMVGALIVKDGRILAQGWHHAVGQAHAEVDALRKLDFSAPGATLYVTLEPCNHQGRTPPCTQAVIRAGITRVVAAMRDPNPSVSGHGLDVLQRAGIETCVGVAEAEARELNAAFLTFVTKKRPYVVAKAALTLDGQLATSRGDSGQGRGGMSGPESFVYVHTLRHALDAILVGANTVRQDNPSLSCRLVGRPTAQPWRLVLDGEGLSPLSSRVFDTHEQPTLVVTTRKAPAAWRKTLSGMGVEVWTFPTASGRVPLPRLLTMLAERDVSSLLVEGGGGIHRAFFEVGLVDRYDLIYTPHLLGGSGVPLFAGPGVATLEEARRLRIIERRSLGDDTLIRGVRAESGETCSPA